MVYCGQPVAGNAMPFVIGMRRKFDHMAVCTGTLIAPQWVLSAGHCITDHKIKPDDIYISTGNPLAMAVSYAVTEIHVHDRYDVSLLRLAIPVAPPAATIPIYEPVFDLDILAETAGWSMTVPNTTYQPDTLHRIAMPIRRELSLPTFLCGVSSDALCGPARGDSGGPLLGPKNGGGWLLIGVYSGPDKGEGARGLIHLFTRTSLIAPWVYSFIR